MATKDIPFQIQYKDGDIDNMIAKYTAYAQNDSHNTGTASKGITHLQDTRRCIMSMSSWIQRDVCVSSRATGQVCKGEYTKIFNDGRSGGTESQNFFKGNFDVKTCGDIQGRIDDNYASLKKNVIKSMNDSIDDDLANVFASIKRKADVSKVFRP